MRSITALLPLILSNPRSHSSSHLSTLLLTLLITLLSLSHTTLALKQPTSYCKCICFQNSTIIPLNSPPPSSTISPASFLSRREPDDSTSNSDTETDAGHKHHTLTCNDCNRAFCLDYNLPICKNAKEEDVFATCFQRDSLKDRTIVILFLVATSSLLGCAVIKPFVVGKSISTRSGGSTSGGVGGVGGGRYGPVSGSGHSYTVSEDLDVGEGRGLVGSLTGQNGPGEGSSGNGNGRRQRTGGGSLSRQGGLNS